MEDALLGCLQADSSSPATYSPEAREALHTADIISDARVATHVAYGVAHDEGEHDSEHDGEHDSEPVIAARRLHAGRLASVAAKARKGGAVRAVRGPDLRQPRVLMQALCEMRLELVKPGETLTPSILDARHAATMALWQSRERALYEHPDIECSIEARLDAGFRHARGGNAREAASEFKRAYLLLCCVLASARDTRAQKDRASARA